MILCFSLIYDSIFLFVHQKPDLRINVSIVWLCDSDYWGRDETTDNNNWTPFKINPYQSWCDSHWLSIHFSWNSSIRPHNHTRAQRHSYPLEFLLYMTWPLTVVYYKVNFLPVGVRIWFQVSCGSQVFWR